MRFLRFAVVLAVVSLLEAVDAALLSVTVGPGQQFTEPAYAISSLAPGFTMTVLAGTYYVPFDVPQNMGPFTIRGAGAGKTKFDGRGGIGGGHRLSWGKGFVHTRSPGTISGIEFTNCGGMDRVADGEAGVYAESFAKPGTLFINRCQFTRNENGIFVPSGASTTSTGYGISISVTKSDFFQNGQSKDGLSHDIYVSGASYSEAYCNHYGNPYGNNIKVRAPRLTITGGFHHNNPSARWLDFPNGGTATVTGGIFAINGSATGGNVIGYGEENQTNGVKLGGVVFTGSKLYIGRTSYVNVAGGGSVVFKNTTVYWTRSGVSISANFGGSISGLAAKSPPAGTTFVADPVPPAWASA